MFVDDRPVKMADYVTAVNELTFRTPTILLMESSMPSGKTTTARKLIRLLKRAGCTVLAAELTGAGPLPERIEYVRCRG